MAINDTFARELIESISGAFQIAGHVLLYPLLRGWRRRWGSTEQERALRLPGDELVPAPQWVYNHAISVAALRSPASLPQGIASSRRMLRKASTT